MNHAFPFDRIITTTGKIYESIHSHNDNTPPSNIVDKMGNSIGGDFYTWNKMYEKYGTSGLDSYRGNMINKSGKLVSYGPKSEKSWEIDYLIINCTCKE